MVLTADLIIQATQYEFALPTVTTAIAPGWSTCVETASKCFVAPCLLQFYSCFAKLVAFVKMPSSMPNPDKTTKAKWYH